MPFLNLFGLNCFQQTINHMPRRHIQSGLPWTPLISCWKSEGSGLFLRTLVLPKSLRFHFFISQVSDLLWTVPVSMKEYKECGVHFTNKKVECYLYFVLYSETTSDLWVRTPELEPLAGKNDLMTWNNSFIIS